MSALADFPVRRFFGALAALALHAIIVAALIEATRTINQPQESVKEIVLSFVPPKPTPVKTPSTPAKGAAKVRHAAPYPVIPNYRDFTLPPSWAGTGMKGLPSFQDCAPQNRGSLTPGQIEQCNTIVTSQPHDNSTVDYADHTDRSRDSTLWTRGRARKNAPPLLPCASPEAAGVSLATLLCLGKGALDGKFDLDNMPGYGDKPEQVHIPNNGDPPTAPPG